MSTDILQFEHPGEISVEEKFTGTERAKEWYGNAVRYTARLYLESAQEHARVREAFLDDYQDPLRVMRDIDQERYDEICGLGLDSHQDFMAETIVERHLEG